jgi:hypothetical protein
VYSLFAYIRRIAYAYAYRITACLYRILEAIFKICMC